jgi:hypothetical protein
MKDAAAHFADFGFGDGVVMGEPLGGAEEPEKPAADRLPMVLDLMDELGGNHGVPPCLVMGIRRNGAGVKGLAEAEECAEAMQYDGAHGEGDDRDD